jgi:hypothetical protein
MKCGLLIDHVITNDIAVEVNKDEERKLQINYIC